VRTRSDATSGPDVWSKSPKLRSAMQSSVRLSRRWLRRTPSMRRAPRAIVLALALLIAACASGPDTRSSSSSSSSSASANTQEDTRTLVIAMRFEPQTLTGSVLNPTFQGISPGAPWQVFHGALAKLDDKGQPQLHLAEDFPQLGTDSWKVFPDGRMETTWRIRKNLTWHDGTPVTAEDFALAIPFSESLRLATVEEAIAVDSHTLLLRYKAPAPDANEGAFQPLPRHILGGTLEQMDAREAFVTLPYWTTDFVGVGPFKLERWEQGSFITGVAFPGYVNGKPRIGRVQLTWIGDANTVVANLLTGTVDMATDLSVGFDEATTLRREWAGRSEPGSILLGAAKTVYSQIQFKPEVQRPVALSDLRFRQAMAHGIDRQAIVDAVLDGSPGQAETLPSKELDYYPEIDRALTKYALDTRRGEQLLAEMGLTKDGEGFWSQGGTRATVTIMVAGGAGGYPRESLVLADGWKRMGIDTTIRTLSPAEQLDQVIQASSPSLRITQYGLLIAPPFQPFNSANYATAATRWAGNNKGGHYDPEIDRLSDIFNTSLDRNERNQAVVQGMKLLSEKVAYFPFYYGYNVIAHGAGLVGPRGTRQENALWKLEEWRYQ